MAASPARSRQRPGVLPVLLPALFGFFAIRSLLMLAALRLRPPNPDVAQGLLAPALPTDSAVIGRVAALGYGSIVRPVDGSAYADTAIWPLQPALARAAGVVAGSSPTPQSAQEMALLVSFLASLAAAAVVCLLTREVYGDRAALTTTWLWAALPAGASLWTPMPYALLIACSGGALLAWSRGRPVLAGLSAGAAALTDPTGLAAVAAVVVGVLAVLGRGRIPRGSAAWAATAAVVPPLVHAVWLATRRGSPEAALIVVDARAETDGGTRRLVEEVAALVETPTIVLVAVIVLALAAGLVLAVSDRQPDEVIVHAAATVLLAGLLAPSLDACAALCLAAIGVWMPLGDGLAARSRSVQACAIAGLVIIALAWAQSGLPGSPWA